MVTLGWSILAKLVCLPHPDELRGADVGSADVLEATTASTGEDLRQLSTSDQLTVTLLDILKANLVQRNEALPTLQRLAQLREVCSCRSTTVTRALVESLKSTGAPIVASEDLETQADN